MSDTKNNFEEESISENIMIALIKESGEINWISTNYPTVNQQKQFQKIFAVTHNPSFVISIFLFIEILILKLLYKIEKPFKGENNE